MQIKDGAGRIAAEVADDSLIKLMKELAEKQKSVSVPLCFFSTACPRAVSQHRCKSNLSRKNVQMLSYVHM